MIATTAIAKEQLDKVKIPTDMRLYLQILEKSDRQVHTHNKDATVNYQEAKWFVSCAPDADIKSIETS